MLGINSDSYTWNINDSQLINKILNAAIGKKFESDTFELSGLKCVIQICPNGQNKKEENNFMFFLKITKIPAVIDEIVLCKSQYCKQSMSSYTKLVTYSQNSNTNGWAYGILLVSELKELKVSTISLKVSINIIKMKLKNGTNQNNISSNMFSLLSFNSSSSHVSYPKKQQIIWKINKKTISSFLTASNKKGYESCIVNNMFMITCNPNGYNVDNIGKMSVLLQLCALPPAVCALKVKFQIKCLETLNEWNYTGTFDKNNSSYGTGNLCELNKINSLSTLTLCANISIVHEIKCAPNNINGEISSELHIKQILNKLIDNKLTKDLSSMTEITQLKQKQNELINEIRVNKQTIKDKNEIINEIINDQKNDNNNIINVTKELLSIKKEFKILKKQIKLINDIHLNKNKKTDNKLPAKQEKLKLFLKKYDLKTHFNKLIENGFDDIESLQDLDEETMINDIGIKKIGHRKRLLRVIRIYNSSNNNNNADDPFPILATFL